MLQRVCFRGVCALLLSTASGCFSPWGKDPRAPGALSTFDAIAAFVEESGGAMVLEGDGNCRVLVSPGLQGRILTLKVGAVESTGLVNATALVRGETDPQFNNFGGVDRFWLGPEAGPFGLYFEPGADFNRSVWKVPEAFDRGPFTVISHETGKIVMTRSMQVTNYSGTHFDLSVEREVGVLLSKHLQADLGITLPQGIHYAGAYSVNVLTNTGAAAWRPQTGLVGVWILGQFNPSDRTVVIAPFRAGSEQKLGPRFNDDYFGKVSVATPDRLRVLGNVVLFRADARAEGKFGIHQERTTRLAGSIDFAQRLLTVVRFDVPRLPERYGNSTWVKNQPEPYQGDALQSYNSGVPGDPGKLAEVPFYQIESTSPVRPLAPGESLRHRHETHHFQGDLAKLSSIARRLLGVDLLAVEQMMIGAER